MRKHPAAGMKAWWKSFRYKIVVIIMVIIFSVAMVININASEILVNQYQYIAKDSFGIIYLSNNPLQFFTCSSSSATAKPNRIVIQESVYTDKPMLILYPYIINNTMNYKIYNVCSAGEPYGINLRTWAIAGLDETDYLYGSSSAYGTLGTLQLLISGWTNPYEEVVANYKIYSNYNITLKHSTTNYPTKYNINQDNVIVDQNYNIDEAIGSNGININSLTEIITNIIENQTETLINIGSEYIQLIPVNFINQLATAEDQLSNAEDVIKNKSESLQQSVNSQWNEATTKTRSFVNTITPATAAITNTINSIVSVMPDEVKTLLTVVPLLLFIGWLLGRIGGG